MKSDRRKFIRNSFLAAVATVAYPKILQEKISANDKICVGLMGCTAEGISILTAFLLQNKVECIAVYDSDEKKLFQTGKYIKGLQQKTPCLVHNLQQVVDNKSVNTVIDATAALDFAPALLAAEAGKHIYLASNVSPRLEDYQLLLNFQKKMGINIQLNNWQMNAPHWKTARKYIQSGKFNLQKIHVWDYSGGLYNGSSNYLMNYAFDRLGNNLPGSAITTSVKSGTLIPETMMTLFEMGNIHLLRDHSIHASNLPYEKTAGIAFHSSETTVVVHSKGSEVISKSPKKGNMNKMSLHIAGPGDAEKARLRHVRGFLNSLTKTAAPETGVENAFKVALSEKMAQISLHSGQKTYLNNILKV